MAFKWLHQRKSHNSSKYQPPLFSQVSAIYNNLTWDGSLHFMYTTILVGTITKIHARQQQGIIKRSFVSIEPNESIPDPMI